MPPTKNPYRNKDQELLTAELNEAIEDFLCASRDLHDHELKLAELAAKHIAPLKAVFEQVQKHTRFRASIFSMFAEPDDFDVRKYELDHE